MFEITVETIFSAAHAIRLPDGGLEPVHGHDWRVAVAVARSDSGLDGIETVMDFHVLEAALIEVIGPWKNNDLNRCEPFVDDAGAMKMNPTAERVAWAIGRGLMARLPQGVTLLSVAVGEAPGCTAIWRPKT